jgi:hypothetical protein
MSHPFGSRPHAVLGASTAHRWMSCPGSVRLSAGKDVPASVHAEQGAAGHMLAEICLNGGVDALALIGRQLNGYAIGAEMADAVQVYLDAVRAELGPDDLLLVEQHFSLDRLNPPAEMFGTADAVIYKPGLRRLVVFDLKYGAGVPVEALGNPQTRYYALGACMALAVRAVSEVEIVIVQPRAPHPAGPIRRETISAFDLVEWSADLLEAAQRTGAANAPLVPGAWCRFCPAAGICPALRDQALATAQVEFGLAPSPSPPILASLPAEEVRQPLVAVDLDAHVEPEAGRVFPGGKVVPKRTTRRWRDEQQMVVELRALGLPEDGLIACKLKSPAHVEKLVGSSRKRAIADLVVAEGNGTALAHNADHRSSLLSGVTVEFAALPRPVSP